MVSDSSDQMLVTKLSRLQILEEPPSPLIKLCPEIWRLILQKVKQKDALNLRLVDNDFKMKVDNLYEDWVISLDYNCPYLDIILDFRVKKVIVERLMNPMQNRLPGILKFPDLLEKIECRGYGILAENIHNLLQSKNLISIGISFHCHNVFWKTLDPLVGYNFSELHTLNINLCPSIVDFYECFLTRSRMPKLKSLMVNYLSGANYNQALFHRLGSALFSLMGRHGQTLKHFTYISRTTGFLSELPNIDESALQNCSNLETLTIYSHVEKDNLFWSRFIKNQSKLIELKISSYLPVSEKIWARVCVNNFRTLAKFKFQGKRSELVQNDLSAFNKCINLRYLELNYKSFFSECGGPFCNFAMLPDQIETLIVCHFLISTEEFSNFLKGHHSLLNLEIVNVANFFEFGINSSVLKDILNHDSLKFVKILGKCITIPKTKSEVADLNKIFSNLGRKAWDKIKIFAMERSSDSNTWVQTRSALDRARI